MQKKSTICTKENKSNLERVKKFAFKLILGNAYITYENAQNILQMETLLERIETLFTKGHQVLSIVSSRLLLWQRLTNKCCLL